MIRFSLFLTVLLCSLIAHSTIYYVAPNGVDTNPGTLEAPFLTIQRSQTAVAAGDTVYIRGGIYMMQESQIFEKTTGSTPFAYVTKLTKNGLAGKRINYWAYPGERPVFDYSNVKPLNTRINAFEVTGSWIHIKGLEVVGVQVTTAQNINTQSICFSQSGAGGNNIYEQLSMHDGMAIGFYLTRGGNVLVLNCDAFNNRDSISGDKRGGNVDGFGAHPNKETYTGIVFRGCRAWQNSDDGYDCISSYAPITFENCWAWRNGLNAAGTSLADGNGFKAGGYGVSTSPDVPATIPRNIIRNCMAANNKSAGFYANHHLGGNDWYNNTSYRNSVNFNMLNRSQDFTQDVPGYGHVLRNNVSYSSRTSNSLLTNVDAALCTIDHNTFSNTGGAAPGISLSTSDFQSLDTSLIRQPRLPNGDLPVISLLRLASGSELIDAGVDVGLSYVGSNPDLGYREYSSVLPTVISIVRSLPTESTTMASTLIYRVTFSEQIANVDAGDFTLTATGTAAGNITSITADVDGKTFDVAVSLLSKGGTLRLDVINAASIRNYYNNSMAAGGYTAGETYTILKEQTITFNAFEQKMVGETDFTAGASASSGLPITYSSSNEAAATIVDGMIHLTGAGTTTITASQIGDDQYTAALPVVQTLTVLKLYYVDGDGDGFGSKEKSKAFATEQIPAGYVDNNTDCDDTKTLYADNDGDGFGAGAPSACGVANNSDCDDTNPVPITATIPAVYAMNPNVDLKNTIYIGYGPSSLSIAVAPNGGAGNYTYKWSTGETSQSIAVSAAGMFTVTVTDSKGCQTEASTEIKTENVECGKNNDKVMVCHNGNSICVASNAVEEHLGHGDKLGACSNVIRTSVQMNMNQIGTISATEVSTVILYPNPVKHELKVILTVLNNGATLTLYNSTGAVVLNRNLKEKTSIIPLNGLPPGIYYVYVKNGQQITTEKIVKV